MLVHNENQRNNMVTLYNRAVSLAEECTGNGKSQHSLLEINMQNCLPGDICEYLCLPDKPVLLL